MKLSCLPVSFFPEILQGSMALGSWIREASSLGLDGYDLSVLFFRSRREERITECLRASEQENIFPVLFNTYPDLAHPSMEVRKKEVQTLCRDIETAGELKAQYVRIVAGQGYPETSIDEGIRWVVQGFLSAEDTARRVGVTLVYENHSKPGIWQFSDFSLKSEVFLRIADALKASSIQLLFDTANPLAAGEDPLDLLKQVSGRVACVHAADTGARGTLRPVIIGTGLVPFTELFSYLQEIGYDGWISLEEASGNGLWGIRTGIAFARERWETCLRK